MTVCNAAVNSTNISSHTGSKDMYVQAYAQNGLGNGLGGFYTILSGMTIGTSYTLSWYSQGTVSWYTANLYDGTSVVTMCGGTSLPSTSAWTLQSYTFTATKTAYMVIILSAQTNTVNCISAWDSFTVTPYTGVTKSLTGQTLGLSYTCDLSRNTLISGYSPPSSPTSLSYTYGNGTVTLNWSAPSSTNGSAVIGYIVQQVPVSTPYLSTFRYIRLSNTTSYPPLTLNVTGGLVYNFNVYALNGAGPGAPASVSLTGYTTPTTVDFVDYKTGYNALAVWWQKNSTAASYQVTVNLNNSLGTLLATYSVTSPFVYLPGLSQHVNYFVSITTVNPLGSSSPSTTTLTTDGTAGGPLSSSLVGSFEQGFGYVFNWYQTDLQAWTGFMGTVDMVNCLPSIPKSSYSGNFMGYLQTTASNPTTYCYTYLSNLDTTRTYTLAMALAQLTSSPLPDHFWVALCDGTNVTPILTDMPSTSMSVTTFTCETFQPTQSTLMLMLCANTTSTTANTQIFMDSITLSPYTGVSANRIGPFQFSNSFTVLPGPIAPSNISVTGMDGAVNVSWSASPSTSHVTSYTVSYTSTAGNGAVTGITGTSAHIGSLTSGATYTFTLTAVNALGTSAPTTGSVAIITLVTPTTVPSVPTALAVTASDSSVTVTWAAPTDVTTHPVATYTVTYSTAAGTTATQAGITGTSTVVTGLDNGTAYTFTVKAVNSIGTGPSTAGASATPATVPGTPTSLTASVGNGTVTLAWTAPNTVSTASITGYTISYQASGESTVSYTTVSGGSTGTTGTVTGLSNDTAYTFAVRANYTTTSGNYSTTVQATPVVYTVAQLLSQISSVQPVIVASVSACHVDFYQTESTMDGVAKATTANMQASLTNYVSAVTTATANYKALGASILQRKMVTRLLAQRLGV